MIIYDFANLLVIIVLILLLFRLGLIPLWLSFFLALFAFVPFFLNDVLFSAMFMSDQFGYLAATQEVRSFASNANSAIVWEGAHPPSIGFTGQLLALVPLPFVESIQSLGFFNRFIATALISWLYFSKHLRG